MAQGLKVIMESKTPKKINIKRKMNQPFDIIDLQKKYISMGKVNVKNIVLQIVKWL